MSYADFLATKAIVSPPSGLEVTSGRINPKLFDFQQAIVRWALRRGRAAVFATTGMGKTFIQLEWARIVAEETDGTVLIFAPLSVGKQTVREATKLGVFVNECRSAQDLMPGINISNYEMVKAFVGAPLSGIVCDESSIIRSVDGATRKLLIENFTSIPWRLCATATPCPNDVAELANHCHFLGVMTRVEMLASFFVHDQDGWRLRGHATKPFYRWLSSWAMALRSPEDIGFDGSRFVLPPLEIKDHVVKTDWRRPGELFPGNLKGITDRANVRKQSVADRIARAVDIVKDARGQVIVWCGLNEESESMTEALTDAIEVSGTLPTDEKERRLLDFVDGKYRVLVTKAKICGFGMNFQNAAEMVFVGLSDSYEAYFQAIRRCWRYGQRWPVVAHVVVTDHETAIVRNVRNKEAEATTLMAEIVAAAKEFEMEELGMANREAEALTRKKHEGEGWELHQGDCVEEMRKMPEASIDFSVYSPPFLALYTYSNSEHDMGNSKSDEEFFAHFRFAISEILRLTRPGRITAVHCAQVATTLASQGVIGLRDFRGQLCEEYVKAGWIYHGEVCIDKDPQAQAIRTHAKGLLFVQLRKDASWLRPGLADYILVFRKPGENVVPIKPDVSNDEWIEFARPVWYGITESDTLNTREARSDQDDRHICALQLGVIERCVRLWSNEGETVFSPFAGIGSEGFVALKQGRRFVGIELKDLYAETAAKNLARAVKERTHNQGGLFAGVR